MRTTRHDDEFEIQFLILYIGPPATGIRRKCLRRCASSWALTLSRAFSTSSPLVGRHHGAHALPRALAVHPAALVHVAVQRDEAAVAVPLVGRPLALVRVAVGAHLPAVAIARVVCPVALVPGEGILRASQACTIRR